MSNRHISVYLAPIDALNPGFGYSLRISSAIGDCLLFTDKAPDTGEELKTAADCLRVAAMYCKAEPAPEFAAALQTVTDSLEAALIAAGNPDARGVLGVTAARAALAKLARDPNAWREHAREVDESDFAAPCPCCGDEMAPGQKFCCSDDFPEPGDERDQDEPTDYHYAGLDLADRMRQP